MDGVPALTSLPRRTARLALLLVLSVLLGASFAPGLATAQAAQVTVTLTANGPQPAIIEVPVGGTVLFVNDDDQQHRIDATVEEGKSTPWEFSATLAPRNGETRASQETPAFGAAGRYTFRDTRGLLLTTAFDDEIGVREPEPEPAPGPSEQPNGEPAPSGGPAESGGAAPGEPGPSGSAQAGGGAPPPSSPGSPPATGGTGTTGPLPLTGGFGSFGSTPQAIPGLDPLAPAIAPPLDPLALPSTAPVLPELAADPPVDAPTGELPLATGSLPGNATGRSYGLPAALALVSIVGVVSLLVRALLAEPAARRDGLPARPVTITATA